MRDQMWAILILGAGLICAGIYISTNKRDIMSLQKHHADAAPPARSPEAAQASTGHGGPLLPTTVVSHECATKPVVSHETQSVTYKGRSSPSTAKARSAGLPPPGARAALLWAIEQKEAWDGARLPGPAGERGPYQITRAYWDGACERGKLDWDYDEHVWSRARCEYIMEMYWRRHGAKTDEQRARQHNGGPRGPWQHSTEQYWNDVRNLMTVYRKGTE